MPVAAKQDWVALGAITQPHGVSGRVKVKSFTDPPRAFADYPAITNARGEPVRFRVAGEAQGLFIIEIEGITKREQAESLRGQQLGVPRAALPPLAHDDAFYLADLIGMPVTRTDGAAFGRVVDAQNFGAGDLLEIEERPGEKNWYSFNHATFPTVDIALGRVVIDPPVLLGSREEEDAGGEA